MIKIVVESLDGYNTAKREFVKHNDIEWYTTSVGLIEKLRHKGVKISNLESGFPLDVQNKLGISAYSIANQITDAMNEYTKDWKGFIDFKMAFGQAITNLVYVYVYKGVLLDRQIDNNTNQVVCVGDCSNNSLEGLQLGVKRFDTIFALLAKNSDTNMFSVLDHLEDTNNLESLDNWVKTRPMGRLERILSIINNTPSSFFYKIWSIAESRGFLKRVCLWPKPKNKVFFYKNCELMDEIFLKILIKGSQVAKFPSFSKFENNKIDNTHMTSELLVKKIEKICVKTLTNNGIKFGESSYSASRIISQDISKLIRNVKVVFPDLLANFNGKRDLLNGGGIIFTNYFSSPTERLFGLYCLEYKIPVVAFEHGITMGLSKWSEYSAIYSGMLLARKGVYHWDRSLKDLAINSAPFQEKFIGGLPTITRKIVFKKIQFILSRLWLKVPIRDKVIVYVADAERNNFIYGPYKENDFLYEKTTVEIVEFLAKNNKDSVIILKLYPTHRYVESCKFYSLLEKYNNIRIVKNIDFRFLRAAVDLICISSSQSTLGWALGSSCPVWLFEKKSTPLTLNGKILDIRLPSINRVIELDKESFVYNKNDMGSVLIKD